MAPESGRRSGRIPKEIAVLLVGCDTLGKEFAEETKTLVLSRHGASLLSQHKLVPEQEMLIRSLVTNKEGEVRVVGQIGEREDGYIYGVAFLDPDINFWDIEFPPPTEAEKQAERVLLECSGCRDRKMTFLDALELDVFVVNQGILRYCKRCLASTVWKGIRDGVESAPIPPQPRQEPQPEVAPTAPARPANRRRHLRTNVNFSACIRSSESGEEIVVCENISRGGFCFKSRKRYVEKSLIEVAIPYTPGSANIFVPARIVHVQQLPNEKLFRCGAAYVKL